MGLFKRLRGRGKASSASADLQRLGGELLALRLDDGAVVPEACTAVIVAASGQTRRVGAFGTPRVSLSDGEVAWCFHPGPYVLAIVPFSAAPETGLRLEFLVDAGDPRMAQQRFDLFLASELAGGPSSLSVSDFAFAAQSAVQGALSEGLLDLPPCTSIEEWHGFRAGLNELLYTRFGVTVEDCYPIDLHPASDLAATLRTRRATLAPPARQGADPVALPAATPPAPTPSTTHVAPSDAAPSRAAPTATKPGALAPSATERSAAASSEAALSAATPYAPTPATASAARLGAALDAATAVGGHAADTTTAGAPVPQASLGARPMELQFDFAPGGEGMPREQAHGGANEAAPAERDAYALRRLFLELPALSAAMRMLAPPEGGFAVQQELLQRFALAALDVNTMPSLAWATPGRALPREQQAQRAGHAAAAVGALDDAWALLASMKLARADEIAQLYDEADRLVANLEFALANRRAVPPPAGGEEIERREPTLGARK
ncbi:hypothetical protein AB4Z19_05025 [Pseudoduganella sp. RAF19]|uniref:hypothetical protein n=1 Tax=Pseudoduganella sp. RAF19 TaxID=3233052 RepID=UPI003F9D63A4